MSTTRARLPRWGVDTILLIRVTTLMGLHAWPRLPKRMAILFSATGRAGNYVPTLVGIFVLPVGMTLTALTIIGANRVDPPGDPRSLAVTLVGTMLLFSALQGISWAGSWATVCHSHSSS